MTTMMRHPEIPIAGSSAFSGLRALVVVMGLILMQALATQPSRAGESLDGFRLASLEIEIWPEFDRPAALVIFRGELGAEVVLPAAVSIRIPTPSGGPTAVAAAPGPKAGLVNLEYDRTDGDDLITLDFVTPQRFFQVEFYEPLGIETAERRYAYVWPGDFAIDKLTVTIQEPVSASNLSFEPNLDVARLDSQGLRYRSAEMGAWTAGTPLPITIRYTKTVSQTSEAILNPAASLATPPSVTDPIDSSSDEWPPSVAFIAVLVIAIGATLVWRQQQRSAPAVPLGGSVFCTHCGTQQTGGARFCSTCGAPLETSA